jgi:uncharacterized membrane protein
MTPGTMPTDPSASSAADAPAAPAASATQASRDWFLWGAVVLCGALLGGLSLARYMGFNAGMIDLGNMAQAIWSTTQGQLLVFTQPFGQYSRLSGNFELFYLLLVPFYALWPDPRLLLIVQAVLFVLGALPAYRLAQRATGSRLAGRSAALIYLFYPVAQTAVLFDFHGDTLAMPLLLFLLDALDRRAWRSYALFLALALSAKLYVAVAVAGVGGYLFLWTRERRVGFLTGSIAMGYALLVFFVLRPFFHLDTNDVAETSGSYLSYYFGNLSDVLDSLLPRLLNALVVFGPVLFLGWRGWRWLLVGLPVPLAALISTGPGPAYHYAYHHYALVVPFVVMAAIEGARRMQLRTAKEGAELPPGGLLAARDVPRQSGRRRRSWQGDLGMTVVIVLLANIVLVDTPLNPMFWQGNPGQGLDQAKYGMTGRDAVKRAFLAEQVPPGEPLAASIYLASHVSNREVLYLVRYSTDSGGELLPDILPRVDYVLTDALFDVRLPLGGEDFAGGSPYERREIGLLLEDPDFELVAARDGLLLFSDSAAPQATLSQELDITNPANMPAVQHAFGDVLGLVSAEIEPLEPPDARRYRVTLAWRLLGDSPPETPHMAVSRLEGAPYTRIVHLPTYALYAPDAWQPGEVVRETFEVELPADLPAGEYTWRVGWYDLAHSEAFATSADSRIPGSTEVPLFTLTVR